MRQTRIILCSPSYLINKGLALAISEIKNTVVPETLENADNLLKAVETHHPDFIFMDTRLMNELSNTDRNEIYRRCTTVKFVAIGEKNQMSQSTTPVAGFLPVNGNRKEITLFLSELLENKTGNEEEISPREKEILRQVALGKTNKEIADALFISIHTVITHRKKITAKLGIKSIAGLTVYAIINGLVGMEEVE